MTAEAEAALMRQDVNKRPHQSTGFCVVESFLSLALTNSDVGSPRRAAPPVGSDVMRDGEDERKSAAPLTEKAADWPRASQ